MSRVGVAGGLGVAILLCNKVLVKPFSSSWGYCPEKSYPHPPPPQSNTTPPQPQLLSYRCMYTFHGVNIYDIYTNTQSSSFPELHKHPNDLTWKSVFLMDNQSLKGKKNKGSKRYCGVSKKRPVKCQHFSVGLWGLSWPETAVKVECSESCLKAVQRKAGLAGEAGSPLWQMRSHYQADENSTSRISQLLCLSHGSVKLGTINR